MLRQDLTFRWPNRSGRNWASFGARARLLHQPPASVWISDFLIRVESQMAQISLCICGFPPQFPTKAAGCRLSGCPVGEPH